jgi:hypothetical protein
MDQEGELAFVVIGGGGDGAIFKFLGESIAGQVVGVGDQDGGAEDFQVGDGFVGVGAEGVEKSGAICGAIGRAIDIFTIAAGLAEGVGRSRKGT